MTRTIAVVQARMGSSRLPGKVLADLGGQPLLGFLLGRLERAPVDEVVLATSDTSLDDPVAELGAGLGVAVVRGSEHDVLGRFMAALDAHPADHVVRITADCPLIDPGLIGVALTAHLEAGADYTSNTIVRTFPDGLDVEVVRASALRAAEAEAIAPEEREHVTPFVYRRPERFVLTAIVHDIFFGDERWTVDTEGDLEHVRQIVKRLSCVDFSWQEVLDVVPARHGSPEWLLRPAPDSSPGRRRWTLLQTGQQKGLVELVVTDGLGTATFHDVPDEMLQVAEDLLRERLTADAQVRHLVSRSGPS